MINSGNLNLDHLSRIYLLANVPSYLYKHYRADPSVQDFAKKSSVIDLISLVMNIARKQERTLNDITQAYAALVALTLKDTREVDAVRQNVSLSNIVWAEDILAFSRDQQSTNQHIDFIVTPKITVSDAATHHPPTCTANEVIQLRGQ